MLLRFSGMFTLIFFTLFSANVFANPAGNSDDTKEFDVNEMIMHHIKDSHEFHIMDINGPVSYTHLTLPTICSV